MEVGRRMYFFPLTSFFLARIGLRRTIGKERKSQVRTGARNDMIMTTSCLYSTEPKEYPNDEDVCMREE